MKFISLDNIKEILSGFKSKISETMLDKNMYKGSSDGIVKMADEAKDISGSKDANPKSVYMKDEYGNVGWMNFPISVTKDDLNNYHATVLNVKEGNSYIINLQDKRKFYDIICQALEFVPGEKDKSSIIKEFDNTEEANFDFNNDNVDFENGMHIKNKYKLEIGVNDDNLFESEIIKKSDFEEILSIE